MGLGGGYSHERPEQMDRGNGDDGDRQFNLDRCRVDLAQPGRFFLTLSGIQRRHERFIAAENDHHQQIGDQNHVNQPQHR